MLILELILTTFELSIIFGGSWVIIENWLKPKTEPQSEDLASQIREPLYNYSWGREGSH